VLGPTDEIPPRMLGVKKLVSPVRYFDERLLRTLLWTSGRYVAPLAAVIARSHPPRVASEEESTDEPQPPAESSPSPQARSEILDGYRGSERLLEALADGSGSFLVRPAPEDEVAIVVELVRRCLAGGRRAVVAVPEARPIPATAAAVSAIDGVRTARMLAGDRRTRFRAWLDSRDAEVVVGTRPTVFAPVERLGLIVVCREGHPGHREDRLPYHHAREVAIERAEIDRATCVLLAVSPSAEASRSIANVIEPRSRRWPPVQVVAPRSPQLTKTVKQLRRGFVLSLVPGAGTAQICRNCGALAACARCGGRIRLAEGSLECVVCGAQGRCARCGSSDLAVRPGGRERVEEWVGRTSAVRLRKGTPSPSGEGCWIGGAESVRDVGTLDLDGVVILDASIAEARTGIEGRERVLTTMMEAVAWARPKGGAIVQARVPSDPLVQALVLGNPSRFNADESARRAAAGFPVGHPVFRVTGNPSLAERLSRLEPTTLLETTRDGSTVCLLALEPGRVEAFGRSVRQLATEGIVERVQADPQMEDR
jgi:primosomal protein N' (replication factor Y) (superfamily II helicase)